VTIDKDLAARLMEEYEELAGITEDESFFTAGEFAEQAGVSTSQAYRILKKLLDAGTVEKAMTLRKVKDTGEYEGRRRLVPVQGWRYVSDA